MELNYSNGLQADLEIAPRPLLLLQKVHLLYRGQFARWFRITAPTSLLAAFVLYLADQQVRAILKDVQDIFFVHFEQMAGAFLIRFIGYFLSWFLGCFALAAITTEVNGLNDDDDATAWRPDSHQTAREHFGGLMKLALLTFLAFLAGMAAVGLVESAAFRVVGRAHFSLFIYPVTVGGGVIVASIVSWLGTAIPLILRDGTKTLAALKKSIELSNGYEGALLLLVLESVLGSYAAWYVTVVAMRWILPARLRHTPSYGWIVWAVAILATAAVEPPLFIGFSLLADPERNLSSLPGSQQTAHVE